MLYESSFAWSTVQNNPSFQSCVPDVSDVRFHWRHPEPTVENSLKQAEAWTFGSQGLFSPHNLKPL